MIDNADLIDLCIEYITDKDCNYLAKEGHIVRYFSVTGRRADYAWHKMSIAETLRIIKAMRCSAEQADKLKDTHLIAAFQELGRVYEFGVNTRHVAQEGIFNYSENSEMSIGDSAMSLLVDGLLAQGFTGILMMPVLALFGDINVKLKIGLTNTECRELMFKHFEAAGYTIRTGAHRPLVDGKKQPAIMMPSVKPSQVVGIEDVTHKKMVAKIYGELV